MARVPAPERDVWSVMSATEHLVWGILPISPPGAQETAPSLKPALARLPSVVQEGADLHHCDGEIAICQRPRKLAETKFKREPL